MDENLQKTIETLTDEIGREYFSGFDIDSQYACWKTNPFLWTLYCAAVAQEISFPSDKKSPTEEDCLAYFLEGFAVARLARMMFEKGGKLAH